MITDNMPQITAHRGASGEAPENTLAAIRLAAEQGAEWVEIDVNISKDGVPVLHHDDGLERCTDGQGLVIEHDLQDLLALDSGRWFSPAFAGERIATLDECLDLALELNLSVNLEIKPCSGWELPTTEQIANVMLQRHASPTVVLSSFSHIALLRAQQLMADIPRASLFLVAPPDWQALTQEVQATNIHLHSNSLLNAAAVQQFHDQGMRVYCYTVDNTDEASALFEMGVDGIFTNHPSRFIAG
jgi:glycerophosphoryl diester phosphodiesterase